MRRREFITLGGGAAAAWPLAAQAQPEVKPVIGYIGFGALDNSVLAVDQVRAGHQRRDRQDARPHRPG